ncbi:Lysophospholipase L1 [Frankineae bacterium MT45]|nr:Lysophospholipase L1 [Frankineae bacterium MT45]
MTKRSAALIVAVSCAALLVSGCTSANRELPHSSSPKAFTTRLVAFGHSYVVGVGASSLSRSWPVIAAAGACRALVNYAHSGDRVAQTEAIVDQQAPTLLPSDVVAIQIGINDVRSTGPDPVAVADYQARLGSILRTLKGHRVLLVEADPLPVTPTMAAWANGSPATLASYNKAMEAAAAQADTSPAAQVTLVRAPASWNPAADIAADQLHPNDAGHALIAASVDHALNAAGIRCS